MSDNSTVDERVNLVAQLIGLVLRLFVAGVAATATGSGGIALVASFVGFYVALTIMVSIAVVTDRNKKAGR